MKRAHLHSYTIDENIAVPVKDLMNLLAAYYGLAHDESPADYVDLPLDEAAALEDSLYLRLISQYEKDRRRGIGLPCYVETASQGRVYASVEDFLNGYNYAEEYKEELRVKFRDQYKGNEDKFLRYMEGLDEDILVHVSYTNSEGDPCVLIYYY